MRYIILLLSTFICFASCSDDGVGPIEDNGISPIVRNWIWQNPLPHSNDIYAVHVFNNNEVIIGGYGPSIVSTQDGGNSWCPF
jgi:hypothetical protein